MRTPARPSARTVKEQTRSAHAQSLCQGVAASLNGRKGPPDVSLTRDVLIGPSDGTERVTLRPAGCPNSAKFRRYERGGKEARWARN